MTLPPLPPIAVTGSTGGVGGRVARHLADAGLAQRVLVRTPEKAPALPASFIHQVTYADKGAAVAALSGTELLFMVSGAESPDRLDQHRTFVDAAVEAGVRHIVYTSFAGAAPDAVFTLGRDHFATEEHIRQSGLTWTFLRDNLYIDFLEALVGEDGVIRGPADGGRVAAVARADVAAVAAIVLQDPGSHANRSYDLTGPEALTLTDVADILSAALQRPVQFHNETLEEAYASRAKWNAPRWQVDAWVSTYTAIAAGEVAAVSDSVQVLTGRPALSLAQYLAG
ncbi:MAG: nucleoside-diphosphate sugar epimerase [Micrococcaceae bacterium]|nr:nucleoside-diphosphate sugar epimerase [Micrococcaceae bacterium]